MIPLTQICKITDSKKTLWSFCNAESLLPFKDLGKITKVLIFCVEFRELSHLTCDLSQAEKKINVVTSWANALNDICFTQNDNCNHFEWSCCHFVSCSACNHSCFLLSMSLVLNGTTHKNQHINKGPYRRKLKLV